MGWGPGRVLQPARRTWGVVQKAHGCMTAGVERAIITLTDGLSDAHCTLWTHRNIYRALKID